LSATPRLPGRRSCQREALGSVEPPAFPAGPMLCSRRFGDRLKLRQISRHGRYSVQRPAVHPGEALCRFMQGRRATPPFELAEIWTLCTRLRTAGWTRDLGFFNLASDNYLLSLGRA
jgi:hypothetical protein